MPVEFVHDVSDAKDAYKLVMAYDGSGRRVSKTRMRKADGGEWETELVTHYTGIGTEVRENYHNGTPSETKVVVNMPQGLGRYGVERYSDSYVAKSANENTQASFEWFLKNHIGSTMLVYGTQTVDDAGFVDLGSSKAAYDYRAFGEQVTLSEPTDKVTENFTGKERDDETELNYFGARYLDPMLGLWTSVDAKRQYQNPYLYAGNNPVMRIDPDGNQDDLNSQVLGMFMNQTVKPQMETAFDMSVKTTEVAVAASAAAQITVLSAGAIAGAYGSGMIGAGYAKAQVTVGEFMISGWFDKTLAGIDFAAGLLGGPSPYSSVSEAKGMLLNTGVKILNGVNKCIDEAFEKSEPTMQSDENLNFPGIDDME